MTARGRLLGAVLALAALGAVVLSVPLWPTQAGLASDFAARNLGPGLGHPFGTDAMGRDMAMRALRGLSLSLQVGLLASAVSVAIAVVVAGFAGLGRGADRVACFAIDMMLALPHLLLLILLCFAMGGGRDAVILAVAFSHWPKLARILRAEVLQLARAPFVETSRGLGRSQLFVIRSHILPHLLPQTMVGFMLMFPHAILHEAGLTFLGFGLEPSSPAIGVMLAESLRHISAGRWWLAVFPGLLLLAMVLAFELAGGRLRRLIAPRGM